MRHVRFLLSVLLALSLAAAPVWAGVPNLHGAASDMSMAAPDECHCCDQTRDQTADACPLKCCGLAAILVEGEGWAAPCPTLDVDRLEAGLSPFSMRPDPPPPRS